jgi:hypothetical protein
MPRTHMLEGEKRYEPPKLAVLGTLEDFTYGGGTSISDACSPSVTPAPFPGNDPCPNPLGPKPF